MVRGKKYLTVEFILSHISEYDIYRYYSGQDFKINKAFKSIFRKDDVPSFLVGNKYGMLYHIDFGNSTYRGNCIDFVMQIFGVDFHGALQKIAHDFGIQSSGSSETKRIAPIYKQPKLLKQRDTLIQIVSKKFTKEDTDYWNEYGIDIEDLKRENIYAISKLYINKKRVQIPNDEIAFGYLYNEKYWKIYRPHTKDKKDKWRSNVPIDVVDGLENINKCEKAIVTKAKKDKIVLLKLFPCTCSVQNESVVALNSKTVDHLKANSQTVYINYDGDSPGKSNSWRVTTEFGFKHLNVPDYFVDNGWKDYADVAKKFGLKAVSDHLKLKGIL